MEKVPDIQISLAAARVNAGYTQQKVANIMGCSKQTIINWEKGRVIPGVPEIEMMSNLYHMPLDYIYLPETLQKVEKNAVDK